MRRAAKLAARPAPRALHHRGSFLSAPRIVRRPYKPAQYRAPKARDLRNKLASGKSLLILTQSPTSIAAGSRRCPFPSSSMNSTDVMADRLQHEVAIHGPTHEYILLLRYFLTEGQLIFVSDQIETASARFPQYSLGRYLDLLESLIAPDDWLAVVNALTKLYQERGWTTDEVSSSRDQPSFRLRCAPPRARAFFRDQAAGNLGAGRFPATGQSRPDR